MVNAAALLAGLLAKAALLLTKALIALFGGSVLLVIIVVVLLANVLASPVGLLFSFPSGQPLNVAAGLVTIELSNRLEAVQMGATAPLV